MKRPPPRDDARAGDAVTQGVEMALAREHRRPGMLEPQASFLEQPRGHRRTPPPQVGAAVAEAEDVVDVANLTGHFEHALGEVVEGGGICSRE